MADMKDRAREYLRRQTQLNGGGLFHCNILNLILGFAEQETKELQAQIEKMKRHCNCKHRDSEGYCEVKRTYLMDLSYNGCDKWELEE